MNLKRIPRRLAGALSIASCLAAGGMNAAWASPGDAPPAARSAPAISPTDAKRWVCPMHPEVHQHARGKCPICKMKLVKVKPGTPGD